MSIGSPFFVDEYYFGAPSSPSPQSNGLSHEFFVDEYHYDEESTNEWNDIEATTSVTGGGQTNVHDRNEAPNVSVEDIEPASPMHFRRVPRRIHRDRFSLVTSENQLRLDVSKVCCAR